MTLVPHSFPMPSPRAALALLLGLALAPRMAQAQQDTDVIHWAYANFLGTGLYRLDANREVYMLNAPLERTWREAEPRNDGPGRIGVAFELPLSLGLHQFKGVNDLLDTDNVGTVSLTPGLRLDFLPGGRWQLRSYAHFGWGSATDGGESAWIWDAALRARHGFTHRALEWGLVGEVFHAGYHPEDGTTGSMGGFMAGLDFSHPLPVRRGDLDLRWDVSYRWLGNDLSFRNRNATALSFDDEWQVGVAVARPAQPFRLAFMSFAQIGLGYRFSPDGQFRAITLNFSPLFDR